MIGGYVRIFLVNVVYKFPASVIVLQVANSEGHVMSPHFFQQGFRLNAAGYSEVPETFVKLWMDLVCDIRSHLCQQNTAPARKAIVTKDLPNLHDAITPHMRPPNLTELSLPRLLHVGRC